MRTLFLAFALISTGSMLLPFSSSAAAPSLADIDFDRFEGGTLYFKTPEGSSTPKPIQTELHDLKYLGVIKPSPEEAATVPPHFLFTAKPCQSCPQDSAVYAVRPTGRLTSFVYPGKILDPKSRALMLESRAFYGRCLPKQNGSAYVVFQKERVDRRKSLQNSVFVAEPGVDHMHERMIERRMPRLTDTLRLVKAKTCHEIDGRNRLMLSRPLDVRLRRNTTDADDDDREDKNTPDPSTAQPAPPTTE